MDDTMMLLSYFNVFSNPETDAALLKVKQLTSQSGELERLLCDVKTDINRLFVSNGTSNEEIRRVNEKLERLTSTEEKPLDVSAKQTNDVFTETELNDDEDLKTKLRKCEEENATLKTKCEDLKVCLEQMEMEYVNCEKYWENKLEEERRVFETEQCQYSEHLIQLTDKIAEYEKEFLEKSCRLPPIEEKRKLEEQFTDLEQEFEDYRDQAEFQMDEKDREIADLKEKLDELQVPPKQTSSTQTEFGDARPYLTNHVIESTNLFSADTMPFTLQTPSIAPEQSSEDVKPIKIPILNLEPSLIWNQTLQRGSDMLHGPSAEQTTASLPISFQTTHEEVKQSSSMYDLPSTSSELSSKVAPMRPKRTRKHDRNLDGQRLYKKNVDQQTTGQKATTANKWNCTQDARNCGSVDDRVLVPVSTVHNMNVRIHHLEQRCRHLQFVLKQQHYHAEQVLQHCWQQHNDENLRHQIMLKATQDKLDRQVRICNEQLERLAKNDLLVKEIYVENAFLVANVQRLEQKCHLLSQCNSTNSV